MSVGHEPPTPETLLTAWSVDAWTGLPLALALSWSVAGLARLGPRSRRQSAPALAGGLGLVGLSVLSPLDALSDALFLAHMLQHLILIGGAAPLLALASVDRVGLAAMPRSSRRALTRWRHHPLGRGLAGLTSPAGAFTLHLGAVLFWHAPGPYSLALRHPGAHFLEHASFLGTAVLFWRVVLHPSARVRAHPFTALGMLFAMAVSGGVLGAMIAFAPRPWIPQYARTTEMFGLTPLMDQQLAGAIMWVPGGSGYAVAALWVLHRTLSPRAADTGGSRPGDGR